MKRKQEQGSALVTVLGIILVVSIASGMLSFMATQQMRAAEINREMLKARLIADSGLHKAYNDVKHSLKNVTAIYGSKKTESFGQGTYTVGGTVWQAADGARWARLESKGVCGIAHSTTSMLLKNESGSSTNNFYDMTYNLLVGAALSLNGNFAANVKTIHANGDVTISGSADGTAVRVTSAGVVSIKKQDASEFVGLSRQSPKEIFTAALRVAIDTFIAYAEINGAVYKPGDTIPMSPPGGVAYCMGKSSDFNPSWGGAGNGTFIFLGDVDLQGSGVNLNAQNGYPALIGLGTGQVKINSKAVVNGAMILPNGSMHLNGGAKINGAILVGQSMTGNGTADLNAGVGTGFNLPDYDYVVVKAYD